MELEVVITPCENLGGLIPNWVVAMKHKSKHLPHPKSHVSFLLNSLANLRFTPLHTKCKFTFHPLIRMVILPFQTVFGIAGTQDGGAYCIRPGAFCVHNLFEFREWRLEGYFSHIESSKSC